MRLAELMEIDERERKSKNKRKVVVLDAISRNDLNRMQEPSRSREPNVNLSEMFAPLLLTTKDECAIQLIETSEWLSLTRAVNACRS